MAIDLSDQVHIVTGAGRGIGLETAQMIARAGGVPIMIARHPEQIEAESETLRGEDLKAEAVVTDVTDPAAVKAMVKYVRGKYSRIDGLRG